MFISDPTTNAFATQVTVSGIAVALLQWLKQSSWFPWLTKETTKLNQAVAAIIAAGTAIGVHIAWAPGTVAGSYTILLSGFTLAGILTGVWAWLKMFTYQEIIYHSTVKDAAGTNDAAPKLQQMGAPVAQAAAKK
jgi:hypothetical protein